MTRSQSHAYKRAEAHAQGAQSNATLWPRLPLLAEPSQPRKKGKVYEPRTPRFAIAKAFRAGHGRYS